MEQIVRDLERDGFFERENRDEGNRPKPDADELDLLPEFCHYRDEGCGLFYSCLECPFSDCIEDQFRGCVKQARKLRDKEIVRLKTMENMSVREIGARFNICKRTVRRALTSGRKNNERK